MEFDDHLEALAAESAALAVAAAGDLDLPSPPCPGWTVRDVVLHTGNVHRRKTATLRRGQITRPAPDELPENQMPDDEVLPGWFLAGADDLVRELTAAGPDRPAYSWAGDHRAAFWARRLAQETAVHRWDAEAAFGEPASVAPQLAADGIDELLRLWLPDPEWSGPDATVHLCCTDTDGEWMVRLSGSEPVVTAGHEPADATLRGGTSDLLLVLWRRLPFDRAEVLGDPALAKRFVAHTDLT